MLTYHRVRSIASKGNETFPVVSLDWVPVSKILRVDHGVVGQPFDRTFPRIGQLLGPLLELRQYVLTAVRRCSTPIVKQLKLPCRWVVDVFDALRFSDLV